MDPIKAALEKLKNVQSSSDGGWVFHTTGAPGPKYRGQESWGSRASEVPGPQQPSPEPLQSSCPQRVNREENWFDQNQACPLTVQRLNGGERGEERRGEEVEKQRGEARHIPGSGLVAAAAVFLGGELWLYLQRRVIETLFIHHKGLI